MDTQACTQGRKKKKKPKQQSSKGDQLKLQNINIIPNLI